MYRFILFLNSSPFHVSDITVFLYKGKLTVSVTSTVLVINIDKLFQIDQEKEETAFQRSCRCMATQRYSLSTVRIDLNALDLQRREADNSHLTESIYVLQRSPANNCGATHIY